MMPSIGQLRGGDGGAGAAAVTESFLNGLIPRFALGRASPQALFNTTLLALALVTVVIKVLQRASSFSKSSSSSSLTSAVQIKPASVKSLQRRFLSVFWLLRCSDWLQGPYFYEVYASKILRNGMAVSLPLVSRLFLTGFASTAAFGPSVGRAADLYGRKRATLAFCFLYAAGAWSTKSTVLSVLLLGRVLSGIGTSLLFSAPESWLVGEAQQKVGKDDPDGKYLGETFGLAYAGDSIVAILAGQMAGAAAAQGGPTGPFELSTAFLLAGGLLASLWWNENKAQSSESNDSGNNKVSIAEAMHVVKSDPKIMLVGAVQSLFEAAMYIFVLQWPPAMNKAVQSVFGLAAATPYGTIFSCFMASCLIGSTLFGSLARNNVPTEKFTSAMLTVATVAMASATWTVQSIMTGSGTKVSSWISLSCLAMAFFVFEAAVGMYFPSIGTLRSRYVPDSHRSVIMNLFGIPLNVLVVSVFLSIQMLGLQGALSISTGALAVAAICMMRLRRMTLGTATAK